MDIAFLGLGRMGRGMAANLLQAGNNLTVWNRTRSRADELQSRGAHVANTPAEAARAGIVITMLADDNAVESAVFGEEGFLRALPPGGLHISMSTISVALSTRLAESHRAAGQFYVSAPVLGRPEAAAVAKLLIIAAGSPESIAHVQPAFDAMSQKTIIVGSNPPAANVVKLCCNFFIASIIESLGEAFALARKSGIEAAKLLEVFTASPATAPLVATYGTIIAEGKFTPAGFALPLGLKDVRLMLAAADAAGTPLPIANLLHDRFLTAVARGLSDKDWSAIASLAAEDAGL
ncbi:MAG TPA: NAD(P)-dependent oxidoreductase [Candidatus Acidoferrum sp.]|nr:NAD(P)-dependent oxidoreductase [Candidatus Acidoferrum sp.]